MKRLIRSVGELESILWIANEIAMKVGGATRVVPICQIIVDIVKAFLSVPTVKPPPTRIRVSVETSVPIVMGPIRIPDRVGGTVWAKAQTPGAAGR